MCLVVFAWKVHPDYPLIVAGNRDEFHRRPAAPAAWWDEPDGILGGRDLEAGGSWLGIARTGRFAVVTNYREPVSDRSGDRSRGELVVGALNHQGPFPDWISGLDQRAEAYGGYNLIVRDGDELHSLTNRGENRLDLEPGIYGLSNRRLDTPWPKVVVAREGLRGLIAEDRIDPDALFDLLSDSTPAPDDELPHTGVPIEWERALSAVFIVGPEYGTRAATVVLIGADQAVTFHERGFDPSGTDVETADFSFRVQTP